MSAYSRNAIFTKVKTAITTAYANAYVTSLYEFSPPTFPCVFIREIGHTTVPAAQTFGNAQDIYESTFEVQIFSKDEAPLTEAYGIYDVINTSFKNMYYIDSTGAEPIDNADPKIFRLVARFRRPIGSGETMPA